MEIDYVLNARELAQKALEGEVRFDGSPFITHPDNVAAIVRDDIGLPSNCVSAVYLHEATRNHKDLDISSYPADILTIVEGLNKISQIRPKDTRLEAENYKRLIVSYSKDPRVTIIKICDRLEVMRNLSAFPKSKRDQKLLETLLLYIPLAHQLGLYNVKREMEDIWLKFAQPEQYRSITNSLKATEKDREKLSREFVGPLSQKLSEAGIKYKLKVRTKSAFSIYNKMQKQKVDFDGVYDVFAIRFIIDCEPDQELEKDLCWKVYSYVTEEYKPDTNRLRDWISQPKPNGYESLHITVMNADGNSLEVQIRTKRMDEMAENGTASHWAYKGVTSAHNTEKWLESVRYTLEHPSQTSSDDLPSPPSDEIFVFTPSGELKILKEGSSVLDFAFGIHSGLGCKCVGGKVNGKAVQIKEKLKTGDVVEIMTSKNQKPSPDWINYVVSTKARTRIKQELNDAEKRKAAEGKELLERRLKNWKLEFPDDMRNDFMKKRKITSILAMLASIADGELDVNDIKSYIQEKANAVHAEETTQEKEQWSSGSNHSDDILVLSAKHVKGLEYGMAKCCNPVFGDDVFGFVTRTEGIKIHRMSCPNAARLLEKYPYRIQKVRWQENVVGGDFQCTLNITAEIEHTVISSVMDVIGQFKASIRSFNVNENARTGTYEISARILVPSTMELDKITTLISNIRHVIKVRRV